MKVLFYLHSLVIGGAEVIVANQIIELRNNGIDVVLVVNRLENSFLEEKLLNNKVNIYPLFGRKGKNIVQKILQRTWSKLNFYKSRWNRILKREKPDLIHVNTSTDSFFGINYPIKKIVFSFHTNVYRYFSINKKNNFKRLQYLSKNGMWFFAISDIIEKDIKNIFNTQNVFLVPNSIDLEKIKKEKYKRKEFLSSINIPTDAFVVGHVGRFHDVKNHERIVSIFKEVHKIRNDTYLVLVGGRDKERENKIRYLLEKDNLLEYTRFLGERKDATSIMNAFDCFVMPSHMEGMPLVALEAQALNKRCVFSEAVPEFMICNDNAFRLSLECSDQKWANLILSNSIIKKDANIQLFDTGVSTKKMIDYYCLIIKKGSN